MNFLLIHNKYGMHSGEEAVVYAQRDLLLSQGHHVEEYYRSSAEIHGFGGQVDAFISGFCNRTSVREIRRRTKDEGRGTTRPPDIVHIHNLYPLISPAILPIIKKSPFTAHSSQLTVSPPHHLTTSPPKIVMTVHNYRLICPNGLYFTQGEICERCNGGREWNCMLHNCEGSVFKSTGYAARNWWARMRRHYLDHVDAFLCLTSFQRDKLLQNGFPAEKLHVLPNFITERDYPADAPLRDFVLFAGRLNRQKGFDMLTAAASAAPDIPFSAAGEPDREFLKTLTPPGNITITGHLPPAHLQRAFGQARFLVFTSRSYEGFPMVFLEAMAHRLPVIAPDMAGFPEIIGNGVNGLLFKPGDADDLAAKIRILWEDKDLCLRLGENGCRILKERYSPDVYYQKLMSVYESLAGNK